MDRLAVALDGSFTATYGSWPTNFVKYSCNTRMLFQKMQRHVSLNSPHLFICCCLWK